MAQDFRESLKGGRLKYANEFSFRKRMQLLVEHISENMRLIFLLTKKDRIIFAETVANTRNYFTHYSPELKENAVLETGKLFTLIRKLRLILQICLLEELGFSFEKITEMCKKNLEYSQFLPG